MRCGEEEAYRKDGGQHGHDRGIRQFDIGVLHLRMCKLEGDTVVGEKEAYVMNARLDKGSMQLEMGVLQVKVSDRFWGYDSW